MRRGFCGCCGEQPAYEDRRTGAAKRGSLQKSMMDRMKRVGFLCFFSICLVFTADSCKQTGTIAGKPGSARSLGQSLDGVFSETARLVERGAVSFAFDQYCQEMFVESLEENALAAHFLISDPAEYGITFDQEDYVLDAGTLEDMQEEAKNCQEAIEELMAFDRSVLTRNQQLTYDTLLSYLEIQAAYLGTENMENLFAPDNTMCGILATNFEEFPFYDEEDVRQYLSFLESTHSYISQCLELTRHQAEQGYFMSDLVADQAIADCQSHYDNDGAVLRASFAEKLEGLGLEASVEKELLEKNEAYLQDSYLPACQEAVEVLTELKGSGTNGGGLCGYGERGSAYYAALVQEKTSSRITPEEVAELLEQEIETILDEMSGLSQEASRELLEYQPEFTDADQMIQFLLEQMEAEFPAPVTTSYQIGDLSKAAEGTSTAAYYMPCRIDDIHTNSIKVNNFMIGQDMRQMFLVIAHETFPGHLYQCTAFADQEDTPDVRKVLSFIGVTEGWAEYAKACAVRYLDMSPEAGHAAYLNDLLPYLMIARMDVGIHYEGWDLEDTAQFFSEYMEDSIIMALGFYYSVLGDPGQFLPYAVGAVKMNQLRERAEEELGDRFDAYAYHQWIGGIGITSFDVLEGELETWIAEMRE